MGRKGRFQAILATLPPDPSVWMGSGGLGRFWGRMPGPSGRRAVGADGGWYS